MHRLNIAFINELERHFRHRGADYTGAIYRPESRPLPETYFRPHSYVWFFKWPLVSTTKYFYLKLRLISRKLNQMRWVSECVFVLQTILYCSLFETHTLETPKEINFFFFYGGSLMDVSSQTAWGNSPLSKACLPASTVETPIHSPMSCVHLLLGLPLPLLPSHVPSKNSFSNVLCNYFLEIPEFTPFKLSRKIMSTLDRGLDSWIRILYWCKLLEQVIETTLYGYAVTKTNRRI